MDMTHSNAKLANPQPDLFAQDAPRIALMATQRARLVALLEALLLEIAAALATGEADDEQDHR